MSLINKLRTIKTDKLFPVSEGMSYESQTVITDNTNFLIDEYISKLEISVRFRTRAENFEQAKTCAEKQIMCFIYEDIQRLLHPLKNAVYACNTKEAIECANQIQELIK